MSYPWVIYQLKNLLLEINTAITNHNAANDSHPDLRQIIDNVDDKVNDHIIGLTAHQDIRDYVDTSISDHDVDSNSHQDIRDLVEDSVDNHNIDSSAHQDIRDIINALEFIVDVSFDSTTGDLVFTKRDSSTLTVNVFADKLIEKIEYDPTTNELVMIKHDGSEDRLDVSLFAEKYTGKSGPHITVSIASDKSIGATLEPGSITEADLDPSLAEKVDVLRYIADNGHIGWVPPAAIASGGTLQLPMSYIPGKNMFLLFYRGAMCIPRGGPSLEANSLYQYEEIPAVSGSILSDKVKLHFEALAGKAFDMWVCGGTPTTAGTDCPIDRSCLEQDVQDSLDLADTALQSLPAHTHDKSEIDNFDHDHVKADITDFTHTHTMSNVTDLASITKIECDKDTGILTITWQDNSTKELTLYSIPIIDLSFDTTTQSLILKHDDGTSTTVDLSSLGGSGGSGGISLQDVEDAIAAAIDSHDTYINAHMDIRDTLDNFQSVIDDAFDRSNNALNLASNSVQRSNMPNRIYGTDSSGNQTVIDASNIASAIGGSGVPDSVYGTDPYGGDIMIPISYLTGSVVTNPSLPKVIGISVAFGRVELTIDRPVEANTYLVTYWRYRRRSGFGKSGKPIKHTHCFRKINTLGTNTSNVGNGGPFADFVGTLVPPNTTTFLLSEPIQQLHVPYRVSSKASRFNTKNMYVHGVGAAGGKDPSRCNKVRWKFGLHRNTNTKLIGEPSVQTLEIMERFKPIASGFRGILSYKII